MNPLVYEALSNHPKQRVVGASRHWPLFLAAVRRMPDLRGNRCADSDEPTRLTGEQAVVGVGQPGR